MAQMGYSGAMTTTAAPVRSAMVRARVNPDLKRRAEAVLNRLGLGPSQAINMLYAQILLRKGLPFEARLPSKETAEAMRHARQGRVQKAKDAADLYRKLGI